MLKFRVPQPVPKKNNRLNLRSGRSIPNPKYTAWHEIASEAIESIIPDSPIQTTKEVKLTFTFNSKHKRDLTNFAESVMDLMVDNGILEDDNIFVCPKVTLEFAGIDKDESGLGWTDVEIIECIG